MEEIADCVFLEKPTVTHVRTIIRNADKAIVIATTEVAKLTNEIVELELQRSRLLAWIGREELMQEWRRDRVKGRTRLAA